MSNEKKLTKFERDIKDCRSSIAFIKKYGLNKDTEQ